MSHRLAATVLVASMFSVSCIDTDVYGSGPITETASTPIYDAKTGTSSYYRITLASGDFATQLLDVPDGSTLTGVTGYLLPGPHSHLPCTLPVIAVIRSNIISHTSSIVHMIVTDSSKSVDAYDMAHGISVTGITESVDRTKYIYYVEFVNESGANSVSYVEYVGTVWTVTP